MEAKCYSAAEHMKFKLLKTQPYMFYVSASRYKPINSAKNLVGKGKPSENGKGRIPLVLLMSRTKVDLEIF